ncbi:hypothetical protein [Kordia jejudonensis]|uniref:hypothetical protein n=1 Tax=Kordia jejudonensis TaxID=1348245 RepID=UPI0012E0B675|nr:hypothetical protein [Kordia jejudonensis]
MKKKNLKILSVKKSTISNLNKENIIAGLAANTSYAVCDIEPETNLCTVIFTCTHNSKGHCVTNEVDDTTRPICKAQNN